MRLSSHGALLHGGGDLASSVVARAHVLTIANLFPFCSVLATNSLALVMLAGGRPQEAEALLTQAFQLATQKLGPLHPWTVTTKKNLDSAAAQAAGPK